MSGIHVMDSAEGAAVRFQLDALIKSLEKLGTIADDQGDRQVADLLAALVMAQESAAAIEARGLRPPAYRGVSLVRQSGR